MILRLTAPLRQRESIAPPHRAAKVPDIKIATFNVNGVQNRLNPTAEMRASNASAGPSVLATRSCRSRTITTRTVYNGDLGVVSGMDMEEGELSVDFDSREVTYGSGELDELVLAYATTIHKSQGSEYPAVAQHTALPHAAAEPRLHGGDARQAARRPRRGTEGARYCRQGKPDEEAVVEAAGMARRNQ